MLSKFLRNYLKFWAKLYLRRVKSKIIVVTGSAGKTSTKEAIFEVLKVKFGPTVRRAEGNLNTVFGVPLGILGYLNPPVPLNQPFSPCPWLPVLFLVPFRIWTNSKTKYLILEVAADHPGDVAQINTILKPDVCVLTNVGPAHIEIFGSIEAILKEKLTILDGLDASRWAVFNADDENLRTIIGSKGQFNKKLFAIGHPADITATDIKMNLSLEGGQTSITFRTKEETFEGKIPMLGNAGVYTALAAGAVGLIFGIKPQEIIQGLAKVQTEKHRLKIVKGKNGSIIIDDSYNANPISMKVALETLKNLVGHRIAVLGEMLELGSLRDRAHQEIAELAKTCADEVISIGQNNLYPGSKNFAKKEEAVGYLLGVSKKDDIILVKASRGIGLETIVEAIKTDGNNSTLHS